MKLGDERRSEARAEAITAASGHACAVARGAPPGGTTEGGTAEGGAAEGGAAVSAADGGAAARAGSDHGSDLFLVDRVLLEQLELIAREGAGQSGVRRIQI